MAVCMTWEKDGGTCPVKVSVTDAGLSWSYWNDGLNHTNEIQIHQILKPRILYEGETTRLVVQYAGVEVPKKNKIQLRCMEIVFLGQHKDCITLSSQIEELIETHEPYRPKFVLLFINPMSGYGSAVRNYETIVSPLMKRCGVEVDVIVTKSVTHAPEVIEKYDLSTVDAVLSMGGDGSVYHITNALIRRKMKEAGVEYGDPSTPPITPSIPFGAIPGGSGCAVAMLATGAYMAIETAVIAIILGRTKPYSTMGFTHAGRRMSFPNLVGSSGVIANSVLQLEKVKWMGKNRYWLVFPIGWWKWNFFQVEIDYLPVPENERRNKLVGEGTIKHHDLVETDGPWPGWETVRCKTSEIGFKTTSMQDCDKCFYSGEYFESDFNSDRIHIDVCVGSMWEFIKANYTSAKRGRNHVPGRYIHQIECTAFRVRGIEDWRETDSDLTIHVDGEPVVLSKGAEYSGKRCIRSPCCKMRCCYRMHPGTFSLLSLNRDLVRPVMECP